LRLNLVFVRIAHTIGLEYCVCVCQGVCVNITVNFNTVNYYLQAEEGDQSEVGTPVAEVGVVVAIGVDPPPPGHDPPLAPQDPPPREPEGATVESSLTPLPKVSVQ
jgi:hypothetical protein